jgi:hypothetical protein
MVDLAADDVCSSVLFNAGATRVFMQCADGSALSATFMRLFNHKQPPPASPLHSHAVVGGAAVVSAAADCPLPSQIQSQGIAHRMLQGETSSFKTQTVASSSLPLLSECFAGPSPSSFSSSLSGHNDDARANELRMLEANMDLALLPRANAVGGASSFALRVAFCGAYTDALVQRLQSFLKHVLLLMKFTWLVSFERCLVMCDV